MLRWLLRPVWATALALCMPCLADGVFVASAPNVGGELPSSAAQKAIIIREGADEVLILQTTYHGPSAEFAWLVPVPTVPSEVFEAEPRFVDSVLRHTSPAVVTTLEGVVSPRAGAAPATKSKAEPTGAAEEAGAPAVTVHARLIAGDYDAAVLSAANGEALYDWLDENGFAVPQEAVKSIEQYTERGFGFVAVKLLEGLAEARPTLTDVPPLGIRFAAERLFYPLAISRLSAREWTSLALCVIADGPVDCETLPTKWLTEQPRRLGPGATYGTLRRELTRSDAGPVILCEYSAVGPLPYYDLSYHADAWSRPERTGLLDRHATRFFGLLRNDELRDLEFSPAPERPRDYRVLVSRRGVVQERAMAAWAKTRPVLLVGHDGDRTGPGVATPVSLPPWSPTDATDESLAGQGIAQAGPPLWWWVIVCGSACAVAAVLVLAARRHRGMLVVLMALVVMPLVVRAGHGGMGSMQVVSSTLEIVDRAIEAFVADTGCYPATAEDLAAAVRPAEGQDASGNRVPVGDGWRGPYLSVLPVNPLGGALTCDALDLRLVDLDGFRVEVMAATGEAPAGSMTKADGYPLDGRAALPRPMGHPYWSAVSETVQTAHHAYAEWLAERPGEPLLVGSRRPGDPLLVADPEAGEVFSFPASVSAVNPADGTVYLSYRASVSGHTPLTGILATSAESVLEPVRRKPLAGPVAGICLHPNGYTLAVWSAPIGWSGPASVAVRDVSGEFVSVARGHVARAEFTPDGQHLIVLGLIEGVGRGTASGLPDVFDWRANVSVQASCDLVAIPMDGSEAIVVATDLSPDVLSVGADGALVLDVAHRLVFVPFEPGVPRTEYAVPGGHTIVGARRFSAGVLTATVPATAVDAERTGGSWVGSIMLWAGVSAEMVEVATFKQTSASSVLLLGLDDEQATIAWRGGTGDRDRWIVKRVGLDDGVVVFDEAAPCPDPSGWEPLAATSSAAFP